MFANFIKPEHHQPVPPEDPDQREQLVLLRIVTNSGPEPSSWRWDTVLTLAEGESVHVLRCTQSAALPGTGLALTSPVAASTTPKPVTSRKIGR